MGYARCNVKPLPPDNILDPPEGWQIPSDISDGKAVVFNFEYQWNGKNCTIKNLSWYPVILTENTEGEITPSATTFTNSVFTQTGKLSIKFGSANANGLTDSINKLNRTSSQIISTSTTIQNVEAKYLTATFKYIYTVSTEGKSDIEYIVEIKNIKIPKTSKYENNVVFTEEGVKSLLTQIKQYPVINVTGDTPTSNSQPYITVYHGSDTNNNGTKIKVGSIISFPASQSGDSAGTFRILIDGTESLVTIKGFGSGSAGTINLDGALIPGVDNSYDIGTLSDIDPNTSGTQKGRWRNLYITGDIGASSTNDRIGTIYATTGNFTSLTIGGTDITSLVPSSKGTTGQFWRGDATNGPSWSNTLVGPLILSGTSSNLSVGGTATITGATSIGGTTSITDATSIAGVLTISDTTGPNNTTAPTSSNAAVICSGAGYFAKNLTASRVFNAVFNDYAECRTTINLTPGHVVIDQDNGSLACSSKRLQPGAQVISDTYGHLMGQTENATTPIAVAGRVLVYTYQPRENYHAGMAVCSAPDGTVDIMSRAEICEYPDCIVGIVSEIPDYEIWGSDNVKVNGRIWIKVK